MVTSYPPGNAGYAEMNKRTTTKINVFSYFFATKAIMETGPAAQDGLWSGVK